MGRKDRRRRQGPAKKAAVAGEGLDPGAALTSALAHHRAGRIAQAERIYGQILAAQPNNADALHLLGVAAHQTGRHDRAITFIEKAVRHASANPHYLNNLGEAYRAHARLADAAGCYRRALELDPGFAGAHYNLGLALAGQGDMAGAVACYRRALEIDADDAQTHCTLGDALRKRGDPAEAIACYRRALEIDPGLAEAHNNLGNALSERGDLDDAVACYRRALEIDPSLARTLGNLGNALRQRDDPAGAIACYRRALEIDPGNAQTHANLGDALSDQENPEAAIVCYRRALEIDPDDARTHAGLGYALSQQDRWDEATACYRRALEIDPGLTAVHTRLGNVLSLQGCVEDADDAYGRALEIRPGDVRAQWGRTLLLPVIYTSEDEIEVSRARWAAGLDRFIDNLELGTQDQIDDAKRILTQKTNFYLHYQGKNDLKLQTVYGSLIHRIASAAYPDFSRPIRKRAIRPGERIRVGFVSSNFYRHTVCRLFGQWIGMLNKDVFEIHTFHTGKTFDQATEDIKLHSDVFHERLHSNVRWIDAIRSADLDALIYTDIGMAPRMQALAALRLAPV
ncbi:MAG: tetratricopeptide repeat protein, partial [Alphaproteobacteria bacterium]|nr:tetratricopeptide repeat protein [Alphaproteobacteria bacterium]